MKKEDLLLKKEEINILFPKDCGYGCLLMVPVYPGLLEEDVELDPELGHRVFPKAAKAWYDELKGYEADDSSTRALIKDMLKKKLSYKRRGNCWSINPPGYWNDIKLLTDERGFARSFSVETNIAGSITLLTAHDEYDETFLYPGYVNFSHEKFKAYACMDVEDTKHGVLGYAYTPHNTDSVPGALLLRAWSIEYLNEAIRQIR